MKAGAVRKTRKVTRICVVLGVIMILSSIGMTFTAAAPHETPPGQDQCEDGHGATDKECKPDNEHGQDCEEHGNGGVNEDHCIPDEETTTGGSSTGSSTGEGTGNATGNATGNSTGEGTGNATGNATGNSTGEGTGNATGNSTGNATGNSTGEGTTGETTTGSSTGGSSSGSSTGAPVVEDNKLEDEVLGKVIERKPLATTGSTTTVLAIFGFALLMVGSILRFGRFGASVTQ